MSDQIIIPRPTIRPLGIPVDRDAVQEVWDAFVKPEQEAGLPQSVEMRTLMAILRAVAVGVREDGAAPEREVGERDE